MRTWIGGLLVAGLALLMGCGGGGGDSAPSPADNPSPPEDWAWRFKVVADGQGYPGSAPYTPGNGVVVCPLNRISFGDNPPHDWKYGTRMDAEIIPPERLPPAEPFPYDESPVQLVVLLSLNSRASRLYTNGMSFDHYTCRAELREALTGRLVASFDFEGDNDAPATAHGHAGDSVSDVETMGPAIRAWLARFY